ncbi:MAG: phospholipid-binding protein MlaC [Alphaproteobacteria bacterium]|jgi:phospholipid transport system substrate-binding protein|nr:ABC transporter substrate-binding protein [Candidatus Jidaibacter sp.]
MKLLNKVLILAAFFVFASYNIAFVAESADAEKFVKSTSDRVMYVLNSGYASGEREAKLNSIFMEIMDIDWIGKFVLGKYWNTLSDSDRVIYLKTYRKFLVSSYVPMFKNYNGQRMNVINIKDSGKDQFVVVTEINNPDNPAPYRIEYRIRDNGGAFKVRDIIAEGVSMLATQRSEFSSIINSSGFNSLIERLKSKS